MCSPLTLANDNTLQDLILAIAIKATQDAQDMMTDMLAEKEYVKEHGVPNKDDLRRYAVGFLAESFPEQYAEWVKAGEHIEGTPLWDIAWAAAVNEAIRRWPTLTKLTVDLK
jgi:hypothetical protein